MRLRDGEKESMESEKDGVRLGTRERVCEGLDLLLIWVICEVCLFM